MVNAVLKHIAAEFKSYPKRVFLVENNDRFLYRQDVKEGLKKLGIEVVNDSNLHQRIAYELRGDDSYLILLSQDNTTYLEDIQSNAVTLEFTLADYLQGYHIPTIITLDMILLDKLFEIPQIVALNKNETQKFIHRLENEQSIPTEEVFNLEAFDNELKTLLESDTKNWAVISRLIANAILKTIGTSLQGDVFILVKKANVHFQESLKNIYSQTKNASAVKKPQIVSKILDYLNFNYRQEKIALILIDGMSLWQYELLKTSFSNIANEEVIYSWIPSITQLSRQAIFRGDNPVTEYRQDPINEKKLWKKYWKSKGCNDFEIEYMHGQYDFSNLNNITKLAIVIKELDDKMHNSADYSDLLMLTKNWIKRSKIHQIINDLQENGFTIFLTSDHGNIQAKGWRGLLGREKLGTNKSGSRSQRHIEYAEEWLGLDFVKSNSEIIDSITFDEGSIYFSDDLSFSNKESLVTHGGSHLLEVLIPFIEIKK